MKKFVLVALTTLFLISCGKEKSESENIQEPDLQTSDVFSLVYEAKYKLDDSLVVYYQKDGHFQYNNPIGLKIKADSLTQKLEVKFPEGIFIENMKLTPSTNKNQKTLQVSGISILHNNDTIINGRNNKYYDFFLTDESFQWDDASKSFKLNHNNQYPPSFTGNDKILEKL